MLVKFLNAILRFGHHFLEILAGYFYSPFYALGWFLLKILSLGFVPKYGIKDGDMQNSWIEITISTFGFIVFLGIMVLITS